DDDQAKTMRMLRDWGQDQRYHHLLKGFNYRMDAIQGSILRVKLRHLEACTEARRTYSRRYSSLLAGSTVLTTPVEAADRRHVYHGFLWHRRDR
ncbi:DegT/DnrJ/EryC1/StrS family aminotransferase, partial [Rhizobium johnstonii]|uniref:DegT/DnrJ/EryC1/StrS family aminotransferase n=1 Tax=Rhizobium johnstonii TaxID=3019933 RepID=UPI003F9D23B2